MNIYIHVEIASRELDSKLLTALRAAQRGHEVLVSDLSTIVGSQEDGRLVPGIFHTKSLTPGPSKLDRHQLLKDAGFKITSIDEEAGLVDFEYESFARSRFSDEALGQAAAVFCWGRHDFAELNRIYPQHSDLFRLTGSPRVDLWKPDMSQFWRRPAELPEKPYVLVSSNFGLINNYQPFWVRFAKMRDAGYFHRVPAEERIKYARMSEEVMLFYHFLKAIDYLAKNRPDFDVVVRPHPVEDPESWKSLLSGRPNIHVVRSGPITPWVQNAFAVLHNGCTTALEATVSGTPVITFLPFEQQYGRDLPNQLGLKVSTADELLELLRSRNGGSDIMTVNTHLRQDPTAIVEHKLSFLESGLAADRMVDVWEEIGFDLSHEKNNWTRIAERSGHGSVFSRIKRVVKRLAPTKAIAESALKKPSQQKFPPINLADVESRIHALRKCLHISDDLSVRRVSRRGVVIARKV